MRSYNLTLDSDSDESDIEDGLPKTKEEMMTPQEREEAVQQALGLPPNPTKRSGLTPIALETEGIVLPEEYLGEQFWKKVWRAPVVEDAERHHRSRLIMQGTGNALRTPLTSDKDLPVGIRMYDQLLKSMMVGFMFIFLLAIPLLSFAYYGEGLVGDDQDVLGLYKYILGNVGPASLEGTGLYDHTWEACDHLQSNFSGSNNNTTCIFVNDYAFEWKQVAAIVTGAELAQVVVFLLVVCHLRCRRTAMTRAVDKDPPVSVTSYSVMVENLPKDVTEAELVAHFSQLYQLSRRDFRGRRPLEDARTVQHFGNTEDQAYLDTWVAEVTIHRHIGPLLRGLKARRALMERLFRERAKVKMYRPNTQHPAGENPRRCKKAEDEMLKIARRVDALTADMKASLLRDWRRRHRATLLAEEKAEVAEKARLQAAAEASKPLGAAVRAKPAPKPSQTKPTETSPSEVDATAKEAEALAVSKPLSTSVDGNDSDNEEGGLAGIEVSAEEARELERHMRPDVAAVVEEETKEEVAAPATAERLEPPSQTWKFMDEAECVCAFVVFEHTESRARCLEDHRSFLPYPLDRCALGVPKALRIRGRRPVVSPAPEPEQILWENLDTPPAARWLRRLRLFAVAALLLLANFAVLTLAAVSRQRYLDHVPTGDQCDQIVPALYSGIAFNDTQLLGAIQLSRPALAANRSALDAACAAVVPHSFHITYTDRASQLPVANYSMAACSNATDQCPVAASSAFCPCVSTQSSGRCATAYCQEMALAGVVVDGCDVGFRADATALCFCKDALPGLFQISGLLRYLLSLDPRGGAGEGLPVHMEDALHKGRCGEFVGLALASLALRYGSLLVAVLVDWALLRVVHRSVLGEGIATAEGLQRALFLRKAAASFLCLAVTVLPAYGLTPTFRPPQLFEEGLYGDLSRAWYSDAGYFVTMVFLVSTIAPLLGDVLLHLVILPLRRLRIVQQYRSKGGHRLAMQSDLDALFAQGSFPATSLLARVTALVFFAMTFGAGLPLLMPVTFLLLAAHFLLHRHLLLRVLPLPRSSANGLLSAVDLCLHLLPLAAVLRLGFAAWFLTADGILASKWPLSDAPVALPSPLDEYLSLRSYHAWLGSLQATRYLPSPWDLLEARLKRANAAPCVALLVLVALVFAVQSLHSSLWRPLGYWLSRALAFARRHCRTRRLDPLAKNPEFLHGYELVSMHHPWRREAAPFTGVYFRYLGRKSTDEAWWRELLPERCRRKGTAQTFDAPLGWEVTDMGWDFVARVRLAASSLDGDGLKVKGEHRRTYEVVAEQRAGAFTYRLELLPTWQHTYVGLREMDLDYSAALFYRSAIEQELLHLRFTPKIVEDRLNETKRGVRNLQRVAPTVTEDMLEDYDPAPRPPKGAAPLGRVEEEDDGPPNMPPRPTDKAPPLGEATHRDSSDDLAGTVQAQTQSHREAPAPEQALSATAGVKGAQASRANPRKRFVVDEESSGSDSDSGSSGSGSGSSSSGSSGSYTSGSSDSEDA